MGMYVHACVDVCVWACVCIWEREEVEKGDLSLTE